MRDQRLVLCNDRYIEMFGVSREVVKPGCTLRELIQHRKDYRHLPRRRRTVLQHDSSTTCAQARRRAVPSTTATVGSSSCSYHPLPDGGWVTTLEDITDRRRSEERIAHLAHYDPLTELPNRLLFRERLAQALQQIDRDTQVAVLYIDIDGFKTVNDSLGHSIGDELLKGIAAGFARVRRRQRTLSLGSAATSSRSSRPT